MLEALCQSAKAAESKKSRGGIQKKTDELLNERFYEKGLEPKDEDWKSLEEEAKSAFKDDRACVGDKTPVLGSQIQDVFVGTDNGFFSTILKVYNNHWTLRT